MLFHEVFAGDILTDFPFIEASFGLSVAGVAAAMSPVGAARPARRRGDHPLAGPARPVRGRLARARPTVAGRRAPARADGLDALCPTGAISGGAGGVVRLDQGRCILCGRCVSGAARTCSAGRRGPARPR